MKKYLVKIPVCGQIMGMTEDFVVYAKNKTDAYDEARRDLYGHAVHDAENRSTIKELN